MGRRLTFICAILVMLAATAGAIAASGAGGCSEYSLSCGGEPPPGGGGGAALPAGVPSPSQPGTSAPTVTGSAGNGHHRKLVLAKPGFRPRLSAGGHLPFTGYPLTPLITVLLAMLAAAIAIRVVQEIRRRRSGF